jgi:hypothetical protein
VIKDDQPVVLRLKALEAWDMPNTETALFKM